MATRFDTIDAIASSQWSLVTRQQLVEAKLTRSEIGTLLRTRALRAIRLGVYATFGSVSEWRQDLMAAVLYYGGDAIASHSSAARLWEYVHRPEDALELTLMADFTPRARGLHRTTILPDDDRAVRADIPCTSFERTLCDCTTLLSPFQLGRVLDDGLRRGVASLEKLQQCAARLDSGPGRKLTIVKELLAHRDASFNPGGSASELDVLLRVIREAGLPEPVQQHPIWANGHRYVVDFAWPERRVFAEYYGLAVHSGASSVAYDSQRLTDLVGIDWRPLVFTDATSDGRMVRDIENALSKTPSDEGLVQRESA
jgi:hypothetical protein